MDKYQATDTEEESGKDVIICRVSCTLNYLTPTKRKNIWEITFENLSNTPRKYILLRANEYMPGLKIKDSAGHNLMIVPRHLLPEDIAKTKYAMLIELKQPIESASFETITIQAIRPVIGAGKIFYEKGIIGYIKDDFNPELNIAPESECSWYISIFAPKGYQLNVSSIKDTPDIYQDENSYILRVFTKEVPKLAAIKIQIPSRITLWLLIGTFIIYALPTIALASYLYSSNLTLSFTMIFSSTAALLAMRAWLFYSVELLDRNNIIFLIAFVYIFVIAALILLFNANTIAVPPFMLNASHPAIKPLL
jgi:hypothetical protein